MLSFETGEKFNEKVSRGRAQVLNRLDMKYF
jgi:hypothetical protein